MDNPNPYNQTLLLLDPNTDMQAQLGEGVYLCYKFTLYL